MRMLTALIVMYCASASAQTIFVLPTAGLFRVEVTINDRLSVPALIDTAVNSALAICETHANASGLIREESVEIGTATQLITARRTKIKTLRIDKEIVLSDLEGIVLPDGPACQEVLIGMGTLKRLRLNMQDEIMALTR